MEKRFWQSKVFWFNVVALIVVVAGAFGFGEFSPDPEVVEYGVVVVTVINLVLRFVTKVPITR